jgi:hypothetical protein
MLILGGQITNMYNDVWALTHPAPLPKLQWDTVSLEDHKEGKQR